MSYGYTQKLNFNTGQEMEVIPSLPTFFVGETTEESQKDIDGLVETDETAGSTSLFNEDTTSEDEHLSDYSGNTLSISELFKDFIYYPCRM